MSVSGALQAIQSPNTDQTPPRPADARGFQQAPATTSPQSEPAPGDETSPETPADRGLTQPLVDPANLSQAQEASEQPVSDGNSSAEEDGPQDFSARLVPVEQRGDSGAVALDGRPETFALGDLVSQEQQLSRPPEPLEVPQLNRDPEEVSIEVFNERLTRTTQVLDFLSNRPNLGRTPTGISIVV